MQYLEFRCLYVRAFRNTCACDSPPPLCRKRNYFRPTHHFTSFRPVKAICFSARRTPSPSNINHILLRAEPDSPRFSVLGHGILISARNAKPDQRNSPLSHACPRLSGRDL
ncbi:hypothetical protein CEXT_243281 [Caerostris extrusa]|uniref:Uncharacterized protein n=1 Tax=Caerostris extrusa TaxID=172846 RepID=A0AAV4XMU1_CAEEX|nr:hypothetical protein CEXT_243281 [Caerostris extrusa]